MVTRSSFYLRHGALAVLLFVVLHNSLAHANVVEPLKRGRTGTSSLIPFPRVGRSVDRVMEMAADSADDSEAGPANRLLFGQKRTVQKRQALIPFPRTGKRSSLASLGRERKFGKMDDVPAKYDDLRENSIDAANEIFGDRAYYYAKDYEAIQLIQALIRELQNSNN